MSATYIIFNSLSLPIMMSAYLSLLVANGLATGGVLNFTLAHVLSTTSEKAIVASMYATFRGLAPSAGSGLAGGILQRMLENSLTRSIGEHRQNANLAQADRDLIQRLKGSPTLVWQLDGWQRDVGIMAYQQAIKSVFWLAFGCAFVAVILQALTRIGNQQHKPETIAEAVQQED